MMSMGARYLGVAVAGSCLVLGLAPGSIAATSPRAKATSIAVSGTPVGIGVSPDAKTLYVVASQGGADTSPGFVTSIDAATESAGATSPTGAGPRIPLVGKAGRYVFTTGSTNGLFSVFDASSLKVVSAKTLGLTMGASIGAPVMSPSGRWIYIAGGNDRIGVVDPRTFKLKQMYYVALIDSPACAVLNMAASPNSRYVATTCRSSLAVFDTKTGKRARNDTAMSNRNGYPAFSPDGATIFVGHQDGLDFVSTTKSKLMGTVKIPEGASAPWQSAAVPVVSKDGRRVFLPVSATGAIAVIDVASQSVTASIPVTDPGAWTALAKTGVNAPAVLSADGKRLYVADPGASSALVTIDLATLTVVSTDALPGTKVGAPVLVGTSKVAVPTVDGSGAASVSLLTPS